jgi:hypothetical protein
MDVYQLFECTSAVWTNQGFSCWRYNDKHYKLDSDIMNRLVDYAEEGHELRTHADMTEGTRELIHTRENEESRRKRKQKTSASDPLPVTVRVFCHGHRDDTLASGCGESQQVQLNCSLTSQCRKMRLHYSTAIGLWRTLPTKSGGRRIVWLERLQ